MSEYDVTTHPVAESCRRVDFEGIEVRPGTVNGTHFLIVRGQKPCMNMDVRLIPRVYVACPEYWGIEVVGCLPSGICLTAEGPYEVVLALAGITGSQGIEVIGATTNEQRKVPGGCERG